jgi:hypothetical protein
MFATKPASLKGTMLHALELRRDTRSECPNRMNLASTLAAVGLHPFLAPALGCLLLATIEPGSQITGCRRSERA